MGQAAKDVEKNLGKMDLEGYEEEDIQNDAPIFTPELANMLKKEKGQVVESSDDENMDSQDEEDGVKNAGGESYPDQLSDSEEEKEDYTIRKTDSILVAATADNDHSDLEVYIYEHGTANLYVHHEIILSSYPLCLEWLPHFQGGKSNLMIVGTFLPEIEIWNLDSENCDPYAVLGSVNDSQAAQEAPVKKFNKNASVPFSETTHTDAIMSLSLNPFQKEYLASASADHTVRIWDLDDLQIKASYRELHSDKVQAVRWNRHNEQIFLSGGYDGKLNVVDVRTDGGSRLSHQLNQKVYKDLESAQWHFQQEHNFAITTESGHCLGFDTRNFKAPVFDFVAHKGACSSAAFSPHFKNMLATVGVDKTCKIWDITAVNAEGQF